MIQIRESLPKIQKNSVLSHRTDPSCGTGRIRPVGQEERNTIETHSKTHSPERVRKNEALLSEAQKGYILAKTKCAEEELEKALHIISISNPRPKNIMAYLLTSAFFNGMCILEPTQTDAAEEPPDLQWQRAEQARLAAVNTTPARALAWFQGLPDDARQAVQDSIVRRHPDMRKHFGATPKPFGVLMMLFLKEEWCRMQGDYLLQQFEKVTF